MIPEIKLIAPLREPDSYGAGYYGAPRGERRHKGVDLSAAPGSHVLSPVAGECTRHGYPYGDDLSIRYIQITDKNNYQVRLFYVEPTVDVGTNVGVGMLVGTAQTLQQRYPGITDHIHVEVKDPTGEHIPWDAYIRT